MLITATLPDDVRDTMDSLWRQLNEDFNEVAQRSPRLNEDAAKANARADELLAARQKLVRLTELCGDEDELRRELIALQRVAKGKVSK